MNYFKITKNQTNSHSVSRKIIIGFCLLIFGFMFAQTASTKEKVGVLNFETTSIDYGEIAQNDNGERTFVFTNTGNAPIVISQVKTSCGCTVPSYSKIPVLPGASGEIIIKYAASSVGTFSKSITVFSNATTPKTALTIKGEVLRKDI